MGSLSLALLGVLSAADPQVTRLVEQFPAASGADSVELLQQYAAGCRGPARHAFRNHAHAATTLLPALGDPDPAVRKAALGITACFPSRSWAALLAPLLEDPDALVQEEALSQAAHARDPVMLAALTQRAGACADHLDTLAQDATAASRCVYLLFGVGQNAQELPDPSGREQVANVSARFLAAPRFKLREHALNNLEAVGTRQQLKDVERFGAAPGALLEPITPKERARARALQKTLKARGG